MTRLRIEAVDKYLLRLAGWLLLYAFLTAVHAYALAEIKWVPDKGMPPGVDWRYYLGMVFALNVWVMVPISVAVAFVRLKDDKSREALFYLIGMLYSALQVTLTHWLLKVVA